MRTGSLDTSPPTFSYLIISQLKAISRRLSCYSGLEDLYKDNPTIPAEPAPEFTKNALPNALLSHTSLLAVLTPVWCCWCPEWRISACLLPRQLWQPASQEITQIISSSQLAQATKCLLNQHGITAQQGTVLLHKLCHSRDEIVPCPLTPPQFKSSPAWPGNTMSCTPCDLPSRDSPLQMHWSDHSGVKIPLFNGTKEMAWWLLWQTCHGENNSFRAWF